jgi:hypothetical protein
MLDIEGQKLYRRLEVDFKVERAVPVARAALGLMLVLRVWVEQGNAPLVALSANVCHDVVAAVLGAGCEPVFCDIDLCDAMVPEHEWRRARAIGASASLVVHPYGNPVDMSVVRRCFPASDCLMIDDAAQAFGSMNAVGLVGGQGDVGLLSFGATKHIDAGGAALLFKDAAFANRVVQHLATIEQVSEAERLAIYSRFRQRFDNARTSLRRHGDAGAQAFDGVLDGYYPSLQIPFPLGAALATNHALAHYSQTREVRMAKAAAWANGLQGSGLVPVGMGLGAVPWRYSSRLPGLDWNAQHLLGEEMRARGLNVSHWYLPAHWMCGGQTKLPGVERLAQEVFQFWVDHGTTMEAIEHGAAIASTIVRSFTARLSGARCNL